MPFFIAKAPFTYNNWTSRILKLRLRRSVIIETDGTLTNFLGYFEKQAQFLTEFRFLTDDATLIQQLCLHQNKFIQFTLWNSKTLIYVRTKIGLESGLIQNKSK